ncbi:MAG TPA: tRNA-intron lyase [archaeon]|nr:tRNA-intron lyase [archaeon]
MVEATGRLVENKVVVDDLDFASLYKQKGFGELKDKLLHLSLHEAVYLSEKGKLAVEEGKKAVPVKELLKLGSKQEQRFLSKNLVFKDLRERGYVVRTGLKYCVDFRVYPRGQALEEAHSKWIVHVVSEEEKFDIFDITRAVRLAQSVKTNLIFAIVDAEGDISYYKIKWIRP